MGSANEIVSNVTYSNFLPSMRELRQHVTCMSRLLYVVFKFRASIFEVDYFTQVLIFDWIKSGKLRESSLTVTRGRGMKILKLGA